jgi:magnesium-protoporphyrin IX monomethyl ester (oxidative) cyclase
MENRIKHIIATVLGIDERTITDETTRDNTEEWDSFNHLLLINNLEKELNISVKISDIEKIRSFSDIKKVFQHNKKVLLIKAPEIDFESKNLKYNEVLSASAPSIPLGIASLSAYLKQKTTHEILNFDPYLEGIEIFKTSNNHDLFKDIIREYIKKVQPDFVCISALMIVNYKWVEFIAKTTKDIKPDALVIVGGGYPTLMPHRVLADKNVDIIILGEGEIPLKRVLDVGGSQSSLQEIDGIGFRQPNGAIVINEKKSFIENVDDLPFMDWEGINIKKYMIFYHPGFISYITSRGCPFGCSFCSTHHIWGKRFRPFSAERVLAEIDYLVKNYGMNHLEFRDDNFTLNKRRTVDILSGIINRGYKLQIEVTNGLAITTLDEEILKLFKRAGCDIITYAIESGSDRVINEIIHKPVDKKKVKEMCRIAKEVGLKIHTAFIVGFPGETKEEIEETKKFILELKCDWNQISIATPFPGTKMFEICEENSFFADTTIDLERYRYGFANIRTQDFNETWLKEKVYDINIEVNFLNNHNFIDNPHQAVEEFHYVVSRYPKHVIAFFCLSYALKLTGKHKDSEKILQDIIDIKEKEPEIFRVYEKYLDPLNPIFSDYFRANKKNET